MLQVTRDAPPFRRLVYSWNRATVVRAGPHREWISANCHYISPLQQRLFASSSQHLFTNPLYNINRHSHNHQLNTYTISHHSTRLYQWESKRQHLTRTLLLCKGSTIKSNTISKEVQSNARRLFSSSTPSKSSAFHAVTGYAFAGKPRTAQAEEEKQRQYAGTGEEPLPSSANTQPRQGFPANSTIGAWVDATLKKGEAGEDALVFQKMKGDGDVLYGVADGVGGWSENGIDPALFSQSLMYHSADYAENFFACPERMEVEDFEHKSSSSSSSTITPLSSPPTSPGHSDQASKAEPGTPLDILQYAYQKTLEQAEVPAGSATACIISFDASKGIIRTANLGDSGFIVLRPASPSHEESGSDLPPEATGMPIVHYQSKPQTHGFNTPLQLSKLPPEFQSEGSIDSRPSSANLWSGRVLDGDMVLVATDGFWDNVSVNEVLQLVNFIKEKHRAAFVDRMLDISNNPLAEEEDLANVLANK